MFHDTYIVTAGGTFDELKPVPRLRVKLDDDDQRTLNNLIRRETEKYYNRGYKDGRRDS